jgi:uncharacterized membrane protein
VQRRLAIAIAVTAAIGVAVAGYLTYVHYAHVKAFCVAGGGGCQRVQTSSYAKLAGVPVAVLGVAGYLAVLASLAIRSEMARFAAAVITLVGFGFSASLTYRELFTIKAICQWCVVSAVLMTLLAILCTWRLLLVEQDGTLPGAARS